MTPAEALSLLEDVLNARLPIDLATDNTKTRRMIRHAALVCAFPDQYTLAEAREKIELEEIIQ